MRIGLRIDVDTYRGTRLGVPNLSKILAERGIQASFFFSVGPDNMGRHLWRLLKPAFLKKMLRSKAPNLYGWDILLRGTLGNGPIIGRKLAHVIRATDLAGHEVGLHAWDHHDWQAHFDTLDSTAIHRALQLGTDMLTRIIGHRPTCSAAPSWKSDPQVLLIKEKFDFVYNSDCRGESIFRPCFDGQELNQIQIPTTLPTYDEVIGHNGITHDNYNSYLLGLIQPQRLNVLTIHAEVEGIACLPMFIRFLDMAQAQGMTFVPLKTLLPDPGQAPTALGTIVKREINGREGWISHQQR